MNRYCIFVFYLFCNSIFADITFSSPNVIFEKIEPAASSVIVETKKEKTGTFEINGYTNGQYVRLVAHSNKNLFSGYIYLNNRDIYVYGKLQQGDFVDAYDEKGNYYRIIINKINH